MSDKTFLQDLHAIKLKTENLRDDLANDADIRGPYSEKTNQIIEMVQEMINTAIEIEIAISKQRKSATLVKDLYK